MHRYLTPKGTYCACKTNTSKDGAGIPYATPCPLAPRRWEWWRDIVVTLRFDWAWSKPGSYYDETACTSYTSIASSIASREEFEQLVRKLYKSSSSGPDFFHRHNFSDPLSSCSPLSFSCNLHATMQYYGGTFRRNWIKNNSETRRTLKWEPIGFAIGLVKDCDTAMNHPTHGCWP